MGLFLLFVEDDSQSVLHAFLHAFPHGDGFSPDLAAHAARQAEGLANPTSSPLSRSPEGKLPELRENQLAARGSTVGSSFEKFLRGET